MAKEKLLPIEKDIVRKMQSQFNNPKIKIDDISEWSISAKVIDKNLRASEGEIRLPCCGVFIAIKSELNKNTSVSA